MFKQGQIGWWAAWLVLWAAVCPIAWADERSETMRTAGFLLRDAMSVRRDGRHNLALRALRQIRDPELTPYFERLLDHDSPALKIHGFLGMAECDPQHKLDLARLAQIKDGRLQAEMISAAMDSDLLTVELAKQTVAWPDLDVTVRLLVATQLIQAKQFNDLEMLRAAAKSDNLGRQGLAGLMLLQLGQDEEGLKILQQLDQSTNPRRDDIRELVVQTALRFEFDRCAAWTLGVAGDANANSRLGLLALRAALRFRAPQVDATWKQMYQQTKDPAQQIRLAFVALNVASYVPSELFEPLRTGDDPMIKAIGQTGHAIAAKKDIAASIIALVQKQHPIATAWALEYTQRRAEPAEAREVIKAVLQAFDGPIRNQAQRFDDAVVASQILMEKDAKMARDQLRPMLTQAGANPLFQQAVLLGLIRANSAESASVVAGLPPFANPNVASLVLLLQAKAGLPLDANQLSELALLVRGGGEIPDTLRLQAAWIYLKRTNQSLAAINQVLGK